MDFKTKDGTWWGRFKKDPVLAGFYAVVFIVIPYLYSVDKSTSTETMKFVHDSYRERNRTDSIRIKKLEDIVDRKDVLIDSLFKAAGRQEVINNLK